MKKKSFIRLFGAILLCQLVAVGGSLVTVPSIPSWYQTLQKPLFTPPSWVFGPVWGILFFCMAFAFFLILESGQGKKKKIYDQAKQLFFLQLGLNFSWSLFFFGWHQPILAFFDILLLIIAVFFTIRAFKKISKEAAYLLYPYLLWISFAAILNLSIIFLNP